MPLKRTTGTTPELAEKVNAFMYRPTNRAYGKGVQPTPSTYKQAFDRKMSANSMHRFYAAEKNKPKHLKLERQIEKLNDTKDLVSEMPARGPLSEEEFMEQLKVEVYTPKPTIFPIRGKPNIPDPDETPPVVEQPKSAISWAGYKPKHQEWGCQPASSFQRFGTKKTQHFAYETSANEIGKKDKTGVKEHVGQRLGNRFTNSFNMHKFHDTGLYTQVDQEKVHGRAKYPY
jgi:hypothetical protein